MERILVPVDFSERSGQAARYAAAMASRLKASIVLQHVMETPNFDYSMIEPSEELASRVTETRRQSLLLALESFAHAELPDHLPTKLLSEGDPADQIVCTSRRLKLDLIVMPTRGRSRVRQFLIGSVAAKVLHDASIPVLTGAHSDGGSSFPQFRLSKVLCAIDLGPQAMPVLQYSAKLAADFGARLSVVHASDSTDAVRELSEMLARLDMDVELTVGPGEPHRVVTSRAAEWGADMIIIGRASNNGIVGRLRAQSYGIIRESPCPVLSV